MIDNCGTTFRMDNGQGGQRIADKQWLPPPPPPTNFIVCSNLAPHLMIETFTSSVESQKGAITIQRGSFENQKGVIAIDIVQW